MEVESLMGRLRARLAKTEWDREMHGHLAQAERCLGKASAVCGKIARGSRRDGGGASRRAQDHLRAIRAASSLISNLGYITPGFDMTDDDLLPENAKAQKAQERREARTAAKAPGAQGQGS